MMRGKPCGLHPAKLMGKKHSPCGRSDGAVEVEDHGNGFMLVGTSDLSQACRILDDYVDNIEDYRFFARVWDKDRKACSVWASTHPGAVWAGATDHTGNPL